MEQISIDDFKKVEIRIGEIIEAENIAGSEKLLKLKVDFGSFGERQILSGIAKYVTIQELLNIKCPFVLNLAHREMMGLASEGMILAASSEDNVFSLLKVEETIPSGTRVG